MVSSTLNAGPHLRRVPDARLAPVMLLPAIAYVYTALMVGIVPTCLAFVTCAALLRRPLLVLAGLVMTAIGFVLPVVPILALSPFFDEPNYALIIAIFRMFSVVLGFGLYKLMVPHMRGHAFLGGQQVPLMWIIGPAFLAIFLVSGPARVWIEMPLLSLFLMVS
jgi:hypothetical protein